MRGYTTGCLTVFVLDIMARTEIMFGNFWEKQTMHVKGPEDFDYMSV